MIRLLVDSSADFSKAEIEEKKLLFVNVIKLRK